MAYRNEHEKLLDEWQKRLGLQNWRIALFDKMDPDDMDVEEASGCTSWVESTSTAVIQIIDPQYYGQRIVPFDWEKTLVHELLHLKTSLISSDVDPLQIRITHQMIDDLARAFVDAKRCGEKGRKDNEK